MYNASYGYFYLGKEMLTHQIKTLRQADELMRDNMLVKHYAGSLAYGTNLPTSDVDFRGVFCADPVNIRTPFFPVRECEDVNEEDTKLYELSHFMKLCVDCNPNIIETLWCSPEDIIYNTPAYEMLRQNRHKLLSSKIAFTTSGYAISQLKRILSHEKWISNPQPEEAPKPKDFVSMIQYFGKDKMLKFDISEWNDGHRLVPYGNNVYGVYYEHGRQLFDKFGKLNTTYEGDRSEFESKTPIMIIKFNKNVYNEFKDKHTNYWNWKKNRNAVRAKLEEEHGYDCYSSDTEFLTDTGWKLFDDINDCDLLASFNKESHVIEYQKPLERFDGTFNGNMYNLIGQHTDSFITPNHNMFIREYSRKNSKYNSDWGLVKCVNLPDSFDILNVVSPKINRMFNPGYNPAIEKEMHILDYLRVMGWFVSDGTLSFRDGKVRGLSISQSKPQSSLTQTLNKQRNFGKINCKEYIYKATGISNYPEHVWHFNKSIAQFIYNDCGHGSKHKRLPNWIFNGTKREMTTLLTALLQGDGTKRKHDNSGYVYYTSNSLLADDVQRLAFLSGYETSKWGPYEYDKENSRFGNVPMYQVHIQTKPKLYKRLQRNRSIKKVPVKEMRIVCFMVKNKTLVTRRNGKIGLHGNCKHAMHLVRLLRMGVEALRDEEIIVKRPDAEELLAIRAGAWSYDELIKYAEDMDKQVREVWYKKTKLPKYPDLKFAASLLMDVQDSIWNE